MRALGESHEKVSLRERRLRLWSLMISMGMALAACRPPSSADVPFPPASTEVETQAAIDPTPVPPPPKTLIICLNRKPESLFFYGESYLYGETGSEARTVLEAIYDGPIDIANYQAFPVILRDLPSFAAGGARLEEVTVAEHEVFLNPDTLQPENLRMGAPYLPVGCTGTECIQYYPGGEVQMERLIVEFQLMPGLTWSDGRPLTAADSLFSFSLDSDGHIPTTKYLVDRTAAYEVIDETTVRWTGVPGYFDPEYATLFWKPLPQHVLGNLSVEELQDAEFAARNPIGWGPYQIEEWFEDQLLLTRNQNYFRAAEGLPYFDRLLFRFLNSDSRAAIQQLLTGECDIVDESLLGISAASTLAQYAGEGRFQVAWAPAPEITRLDFNVAPIGRPGEGYFEEPRTRRALTHCIDRDALLADVLLGFGSLAEGYLASGNPIKSSGPGLPRYDPDAGRALLTEVGWIDMDEDGSTPREAYGVPGVAYGTDFSFTLVTAEGDLNAQTASLIQADLAACGVEVKVESIAFSDLTAPYPDGQIFGRGFDAVLWSWPEWITPLCEMFAERELPAENSRYGVNATGWNDLAYNQACDRVLLGRVDHEQYIQALQATQDIFIQALPGVPLYQTPRFVAYSNNICGIEIDPLSFSALFGLEQIDSGTGCP